MVLVLGSTVVRDGSFAEALALSKEHVNRSRAEPGCIAHAVYQDGESPGRLVFIEQWSSQEALWQHFKVPASRTFAKALAGLCTEAPSMALYEAAEIPVFGKNAT